jgi:hypothetical protein
MKIPLLTVSTTATAQPLLLSDQSLYRSGS